MKYLEKVEWLICKKANRTSYPVSMGNREWRSSEHCNGAKEVLLDEPTSTLDGNDRRSFIGYETSLQMKDLLW